MPEAIVGGYDEAALQHTTPTFIARIHHNSDCEKTMSNMNDQNPFAAGPQGNAPQYYQPQSSNEGDATGGIIPYKNPKALIAYYLAVGSLIPLLGIPLGIAAFVLGIMGLRDRARNPVIKGSLHASIGIGCGGFFFLLWTSLAVIMVIGIMGSMR